MELEIGAQEVLDLETELKVVVEELKVARELEKIEKLDTDKIRIIKLLTAKIYDVSIIKALYTETERKSILFLFSFFFLLLLFYIIIINLSIIINIGRYF